MQVADGVLHRRELSPGLLELQELYVDPQTVGEMVQDCDVCCRPWRVLISRDEDGGLQVYLERA